jgi:phage terminase large subunit
MALRLTEKQKKGMNILCSPAKTRILFDGGARSGKTSLLMEYIMLRAFQFPGSRQLIARKYKAHAKQSIWNDTLKRYLDDNIPAELYSKSETELTVKLTNGSSLTVSGLDDAERVEKILGNEYITVLLNEATQLSWQTVQIILTRLSQTVYDSGGGKAVPKLCMDCNPRGPRHWLHIAGIRHTDPESGRELKDKNKWARLSWSAFDNITNLPEEYIRSLESLPDVMRDRMLNGIWRNNSGAVYDEFNEEIHVIPDFEIPLEWRKLRAVDFGYTNPFVCLWGALDSDGRLYIYRELYKRRERTAVLAEKINRLTGTEKIFMTTADHDAAERAELEVAGIYTSAAKKNVSLGIQAVKNRLAICRDGKPRLFFFPCLKNLLSEIYDYSWAENLSGNKEEPTKANDHAMDALRYMITAVDYSGGGEIKITSANTSDGRFS